MMLPKPRAAAPTPNCSTRQPPSAPLLPQSGYASQSQQNDAQRAAALPAIPRHTQTHENASEPVCGFDSQRWPEAGVMAPRFMSGAEVAVLEGLLPDGMTDSMRAVAVGLFEALVLSDERAGQTAPAGPWLEQLQTWAGQVFGQIQHLANEVGGQAIYFAKGVLIQLSRRDRELAAKFRGNNIPQLAHEYRITPTRVRQILKAVQREQGQRRQLRPVALVPATPAA